MSDTRISAVDLLRLAAIASVSPEGTADEVVAILQRTGPVEAASADHAPQIGGLVVQHEVILGDAAAAAARAADSDKLAKPE